MLITALAALGAAFGVAIFAARPKSGPPKITDDDEERHQPRGPWLEIREPSACDLGGITCEPEAENDEPTAHSSAFSLRSGAKTDPGSRRKRNEDALLVLRREGIYAVADGMGGHVGGALASQLALEAIAHTFQANRFAREGRLKVIPRRAEELVVAIANANEVVRRAAQDEGALGEMGTTLVAARFCPRKRRMYIGHVGDSRCYRLRAGKLELLTTDHTMAAFGVKGRAGEMLSRVVGVRERVEPDVKIGAPEMGDVYLLCSDGLTNMVPEDFIVDVLARLEQPEHAARDLVRLANDRGGLDNITAVIVCVDSVKAV